MINLLLTGNSKVFDGIAMLLMSATKNCKEAFNVYVLSMDLSDMNPNYTSISKSDIQDLEKYLKQRNKDHQIRLIDVTDLYNKELAESVNKNTSYSPYSMIRLLADEVKEIPDKVLYLDVDILVPGNLSKLYDYDVKDYDYAACKDYYGRVFINKDYINSGVMLYNMKRIRQNHLFAKCREVVRTKRMQFPDQSALNTLTDAKLFLPMKFNSQRRDHEDDVVRHFCKSIRWFPIFRTLNVKPWQVERMHKKLKCHKFDDIIEEWQQFKLNKEVNNEKN